MMVFCYMVKMESRSCSKDGLSISAKRFVSIETNLVSSIVQSKKTTMQSMRACQLLASRVKSGSKGRQVQTTRRQPILNIKGCVS